MIRGNKGEWSEFYAFLKLLTDGKLFNADANLAILEDNFYVILKIIRDETGGRRSYDISRGNGEVIMIDEVEGSSSVINIEDIKSKVAAIFEEMKSSKDTTFQILSAETVMNDLHCSQIKASNEKKADLVIILHDKKSPTFPELGFSIKSMLGSPSTLLNASGATNFTYKIVETNSADPVVASGVHEFSVREKSAHIYETGGSLEFVEMDNVGFKMNLRNIDSNFPEIIAEIIKYYYIGRATKVDDLVDYISEDEDFCKKFDLNKRQLVLKVKRFLSAIALGMTPKKEWDGYASAHGGYIIVKENGEVVCYHIYNRDQFEEYLFRNTKLDTPSTGRHKFGSVYTEKGENRIKYNLQIRFIK